MQKTCKIHGSLNIDDIQIEKISWKNKNGEKIEGQQLRCRICRREKDMKWKNANREKHIASSSRWRNENKEHYLEWLRQDRLINPEKHKKWKNISKEKQGRNWRRKEAMDKYGFTIENYEKMLEVQNNLCAICFKSETRKSRTEGNIARLCVDHCHKTNIVRGLLCSDCNTGIGKLNDSIETLQSAINYLNKYAT